MKSHAVRACLAVVLAVSACTDNADSTAPSEPASTTLPPVTSATAGPTTSGPTSSATTSAVPTSSETCPAGPAIPPDAADLTSIDADLNDDGLSDSLQIYAAPSDDRWHIRIEYGGGGATDEAIVDSDLSAPARPIGIFDVEGDGTAEIFAIVGSGAATLLVGLYDVDGCTITRVTIDGAPAVFPVGATASNVSGLTCEGLGDLDRMFATRVGDDTFEGGFEPYVLNGSALTAGTGDGAGFTDAEAAALATFECGDLTLP